MDTLLTVRVSAAWRQHRPLIVVANYRISPSSTRSSSSWGFARNFGTEQSTKGEIPAAASDDDAAAAKDASEGEGAEPAAGGGAADVDGAVVEDPKIAQLESQIKDLKDNLLRSLAEQENTRRIAARDVANAKSFSIASFAKSLLDTSDNLSRALDAVPPDMRVDRDNHPILANLYQGISMTDAGLNSAFERNGLTKFGSRGEKFDPNMHDALFEYPNETGGVAPGHIGQVMKVFFMLNNRVVRPAEVGSDNLSRALDAIPLDMRDDRNNHPILANLYQGISMTDAGLNRAFERNGLTKFGSRGEKFDPNMHVALFEYPDETGGVAPGHIGQVMKVFFMLNNRVVRPAEAGVVKAS